MLPKANRPGAERKVHGSQLIRMGLRYVPVVARRYSRVGLDLEELIAAGNLGLVEAALRFDGSRGVKFVTYADWWIRKAILASLEALLGPVRVPRYWQARLRWLRQSQAIWKARFGSQPTADQLALSTGLPVEQVRRLLRHTPRAVSLDQKPREDSARTVGETLEAPQSSPQEALIRRDLARRMRGHIADLDDREGRILTLRFGLDGDSPLTLREVADLVGLSRERVRQIELNTLVAIRDRLEAGADDDTAECKF